jgi:Xaa-Pro aminopeptidase
LAQLLKEAGSMLDPDGVAQLIAGILAAPPEIATSWHALVADPTPPALAEALEAMRAALARDFSDGLATEDFVRLPRAARVKMLRDELAAHHLDGFIVPRADEHQGEYVPACGQRLAWLTGFTGSAGMAVVLQERAALFVDGRYTLQAAAQADTALFEIHHLIDEPPGRWLTGALKKGMVVGYDSWLHTPQEVERLRSGAERSGASLKAVDNPIDRIWPARPRMPLAPVVPHPDRFAGESAAAKRSPGSSTSAAATCRIRRCRYPSRCCARMAASPSLSTAGSSPPGSSATSGTASRSRRPSAWGRRSISSPPPEPPSRSTRRPPPHGSSIG